MSYDAIAQRASRDQLKHAGGRPMTYTPVGQAPLAEPVMAQVMRDLERERQGLDVPVLQRLHVINLLHNEVPKPRRGDTVHDNEETWRVDDVLEDNGFVVQVAVTEVPGE